jgi:hypothetical protein
MPSGVPPHSWKYGPLGPVSQAHHTCAAAACRKAYRLPFVTTCINASISSLYYTLATVAFARVTVASHKLLHTTHAQHCPCVPDLELPLSTYKPSEPPCRVSTERTKVLRGSGLVPGLRLLQFHVAPTYLFLFHFTSVSPRNHIFCAAAWRWGTAQGPVVPGPDVVCRACYVHWTHRN